MIDFKSLRSRVTEEGLVERLGPVERLLSTAAALLRNDTGLKLVFYSKLMNFIRLIALYVVEKNGLRKLLADQRGSGTGGMGDDRALATLMVLLYHFGITRSARGRLVMARRFARIGEGERRVVFSAVEESAAPRPGGVSAGYRGVIEDFLFVRRLIGRYRNPRCELRDMPRGEAWGALIAKGGLDYEVRLCETLFNLSRLVVGGRIPSPFEESYYTESGRNAFRNFTGERFGRIVESLERKAPLRSVLDIGCGYGDYLDVLARRLPGAALYGIELQEKVFAETRARFAGNDSIVLLNTDFFRFRPDMKFDLVLLNYVLFYFNHEEKRQLFRRIVSMLSDRGSILVCQYFQGIEGMKRELALRQGDLSFARKIEMYYSNKILYANTLWNDTADAFSESVRWNELAEILDGEGLEIRSLTNADRYYFSLFLEIRRKGR